MATRITTIPVKQRFEVVESGANTFTQVDISLPLAVISGNRIQAIEILQVVSDPQPPDSEDAQFNEVIIQLTRDSQTAEIHLNNDDLIWKRVITIDNSAINGSFLVETIKYDSLVPPGDDRGEIVLERTIHISTVGVGNAGAKTTRGYFNYHIVNLSAEEVVIQLFVDDI